MTTNQLTPGASGFTAHCSDKHADTLFSDRAEWVWHQRMEHKNTDARYRPARPPRVAVSIGAAESAQLGRWITDPRGKYGQIISLAPGRDSVWVSFGGSDIGRFQLFELTSSAAPAHTLSLLDPEPAPAPVAPVAAPAAPVAPEPTPAAPEPRQAPRPPKRRAPARPRVCGHAGPNGADVAAYWQTIEARYFAAIA